MSLYIVKGDLLEQKVDAIVVPTTPQIELAGAIGGRIKKLGDKLLEYDIKQLKPIQSFGSAVIVNAYKLECKKIILVADPKWQGGTENEAEFLADSYINSMELANAYELNSIAFPVLSTGVYKYPKAEAIQIALDSIKSYLEDCEELNVFLVIYDKQTFNDYQYMFKGLEIIDGDLYDAKQIEKEDQRMELNRLHWLKKGTMSKYGQIDGSNSFANKLNSYIVLQKVTQEQCFGGVISGNMFNKIMHGSKPKKYTAIALGLNIGLSEWEINDLLLTLGYSLDEKIPADFYIIQLANRGKTIPEINDVLKKHNCVPLPYKE